MGFPFYKDVQDEWVLETSLEIDEDQTIYDLIDVEEGHDFKIKKEKTGNNNWDISYEKSLATKKARELTDEEMELAKGRVNLRTFIEYATYEEVMSAFEEFLSNNNLGDLDDGKDDDEAEVETKTESKSKTKKRVIDEDDEDDDEDEAETPKSKSKTKKRVIDDDDEDDDEVETSKPKSKTKSKKKVEVEEDEDDMDDDFLDDLDDDE